MKANDLKPGMAIMLDKQLYSVVKAEHVKPGKGPAYAQLKLKNFVTGSHIERRMGTSDNVESATLDRRTCEYLYNDGVGAVFMDAETYDQFTIEHDTLGDSKLYLVPNLTMTIQFFEGRPINFDLPASVEMKVTETTPGIKGATVTNQLKDATLETGLKTKVPPFINEGETVRISTLNGEYQSRCN